MVNSDPNDIQDIFEHESENPATMHLDITEKNEHGMNDEESENEKETMREQKRRQQRDKY